MSEISEYSVPPFGGIEIGRRVVAHRLISARLREQIIQGEIAPGTELPPTAALAEQWKTSYFTAHTALKNLVKEGLLERKHGAGTYVREQRGTLDCIGLYYDETTVWTDDEKAFYRNVYGALERQLRKQRMTLRVFADPRGKDKRHTILPELRAVLDSHEIQGLIAPMAGADSLRWLLKLAIPLSVMSSRVGLANKVGLDEPHNLLRMLTHLKAQGCRTVGIISNLYADERARFQSERLLFDERFAEALTATGMRTRPSWIRKSKTMVLDGLSRFGYREFHELWSQSEHPDAVIAFPDMVVRGVILAAMEAGVRAPQDVRFFFHRNAHVDMLCPFPAGWEITDEGKVAKAMITMVRDLHQGKKVQPVYIRNEFEDHEGESRLSPAR
jgi:DNA-binding LacI/PurR family transcriptional regulator